MIRRWQIFWLSLELRAAAYGGGVGIFAHIVLIGFRVQFAISLLHFSLEATLGEWGGVLILIALVNVLIAGALAIARVFTLFTVGMSSQGWNGPRAAAFWSKKAKRRGELLANLKD